MRSADRRHCRSRFLQNKSSPGFMQANRFLLCFFCVLCGGALLSASSPKFFQATTQADFLKGDVDNLSIDARGQLVLGPALDLVFDTPAPFVWTVATAADGSFYLGTGN